MKNFSLTLNHCEEGRQYPPLQFGGENGRSEEKRYKKGLSLIVSFFGGRALGACSEPYGNPMGTMSKEGHMMETGRTIDGLQSDFNRTSIGHVTDINRTCDGHVTDMCATSTGEMNFANFAKFANFATSYFARVAALLLMVLTLGVGEVWGDVYKNLPNDFSGTSYTWVDGSNQTLKNNALFVEVPSTSTCGIITLEVTAAADGRYACIEGDAEGNISQQKRDVNLYYSAKQIKVIAEKCYVKVVSVETADFKYSDVTYTEAKLVYFAPGTWNQADAKFSAYSWSDGDNKVTEFLRESCSSGIFVAYIPQSHSNIVFIRNKDTSTKPGFNNTGSNDNFWNKSEDLTIQTGKRYTITDWSAGNWDNDAIDCPTRYYLAGANFDGWNADQNLMTDNGDGTYTWTSASVSEGTHEFKITDGTWNYSWGCGALNILTNCTKNCANDGDDASITTTAAGPITFVFVESTKKINVAASSPVAPSTTWFVKWNNGSSSSAQMTEVESGHYKSEALSLGSGDSQYFNLYDGTTSYTDGATSVATSMTAGTEYSYATMKTGVYLTCSNGSYFVHINTNTGKFWLESATYTITLDKNGGDANGTATVRVGDNHITITQHATRTNYHMSQSGGTYAYYSQAGEAVSAQGEAIATYAGNLKKTLTAYTDENGLWKHTANVTLYAHWVADDITYVFNLDQTDATTLATNQSVTGLRFDKAPTKLGDTYLPKRTGYTFLGYYTLNGKTSGDWGSMLIDGNGNWQSSVAGFTDENGKWTYTGEDVITVYPKWELATYTITYKDGSKDFVWGDVVHPTTHTYNTTTDLVAAPNKKGYTFGGWYTASDCTGDAVTSLGTTAFIANITLYAKWIPNVTTITVHRNYSNDDKITYTLSATYDKGISAVIGLSTVSREWTGYVFSDIYTDKSNGSRIIQYVNSNWALQKGVTNYTTSANDPKWQYVGETLDLYIHWKAQYTVTLDNQSATTPGETSITVVKGSKTGIATGDSKPYTIVDHTMPTKAGATFGGYYTDRDGAGVKLIDEAGHFIAGNSYINAESYNWNYDGNVTLYAKWIADMADDCFVIAQATKNAENNGMDASVGGAIIDPLTGAEGSEGYLKLKDDKNSIQLTAKSGYTIVPGDVLTVTVYNKANSSSNCGFKIGSTSHTTNVASHAEGDVVYILTAEDIEDGVVKIKRSKTEDRYKSVQVEHCGAKWQIAGSITGQSGDDAWKPIDLTDNSYYEVNLGASTNYTFKLVKDVNGAKTWYTMPSPRSITATTSDITFEDGNGHGNETTLRTADAGTYRIDVNTTGEYPIVSVVYPTPVPVVAENYYIYLGQTLTLTDGVTASYSDADATASTAAYYYNNLTQTTEQYSTEGALTCSSNTVTGNTLGQYRITLTGGSRATANVYVYRYYAKYPWGACSSEPVEDYNKTWKWAALNAASASTVDVVGVYSNQPSDHANIGWDYYYDWDGVYKFDGSGTPNLHPGIEGEGVSNGVWVDDNANAKDHGGVKFISIGSSSLSCGDYMKLTYTTEGGRSLTGTDAPTVGGAYTHAATADPAYTLTYAIKPDALANAAGTITHDAPADKVASGTVVTFTATENDGYHFAGWYSDAACETAMTGGTANQNRYQIAVTAAVNIYAKFEKAVTGIELHALGDINELGVGQTLQLSVTYIPEDATYGHEITSWVSDNENYLRVNGSGLVTAVAAGANHFITATTTNGKSNTYYINVVSDACDGYSVHMWNTEGTHTRACLEQYNGNDYRSGQVTLPSNSDAEQLKVLYQGNHVDGRSAQWTTRWLPMIGKQDNGSVDQIYPGQDAVGYFRIFIDSKDPNYYLGFQPTYVLTYGVHGVAGWKQVEFAEPASGHEYQTDVVKVPVNYFSTANFNCYVGTKRANGTSPFVAGHDSKADRSEEFLMKNMNGLTSDKGGHYGYYMISDNHVNKNWNVSFVSAYAYELRLDDETIFSYGASKTNSNINITSETPSKSGYTFLGWDRTKGKTELSGTDYITAGSDYKYWSDLDVFYPVWEEDAPSTCITFGSGKNISTNGTYTGTAPFTVVTYGLSENATKLDGDEDYVTITSTKDITAITITGYVNNSTEANRVIKYYYGANDGSATQVHNVTLTKTSSDVELTLSGTGIRYIKIQRGTKSMYITQACMEIDDAEACTTPVLPSLEDQTLCVGDNAAAWNATQTAVLATGETVTYEWKRGSTVLSETGATLSLTSVKAADAGTYTVTATVSADGKSSTSASTTATLTVNVAPAVPTISSSLSTIYPTNEVTLTAACATMGVTYQWYICDEDGSNESAIGGATNATYTIASAPVAGTYYYKVRVNDGKGNSCSTTDSEVHTMVVSAVAACNLYFYYPNVEDIPVGKSNDDGTHISSSDKHSTELGGSITIDEETYTVTKRTGTGQHTGIKFKVPTGYTGTLYMLAVSSGDGARTVTLTPETGEAISLAIAGGASAYKTIEQNLGEGVWTVTGASGNWAYGFLGLKLCPNVDCTDPTPIITINNVMTAEHIVSVCEDTENVVFTATGAAAGADYQWYKDGQLLNGSDDNTSTKTIAIVQTSDAGEYYVVATREGCNRESTYRITLNVLTAPVFGSFEKSVAVMTGQKVIINDVEATNATSYVWYKSTDETFNAGTDTQVGEEKELSLNADAVGTFYLFCVATNSCGSTTSDAITVTVTQYKDEECAAKGSEGEAEFGFDAGGCTSVSVDGTACWRSNAGDRNMVYTVPEGKFFKSVTLTVAVVTTTKLVLGYSLDGSSWTYVEKSGLNTTLTDETYDLSGYGNVVKIKIGRNTAGSGHGDGSGSVNIAKACFEYGETCFTPTIAPSVPSKNHQIGDAFEEPTFTVTGKESANITSRVELSYSSSDEEIATVDSETGEVEFEGKTGTVTITATYVGGSVDAQEYCEATGTYTITVSCATAAPVISASATEITSAEGVTLTITKYNSTKSYQWYADNGVIMEGQTAATFNALRSGKYYVVLSDECVQSSNVLTITSNIPEPTVKALAPFQYYHVDKTYSDQMKMRHLFAVKAVGNNTTCGHYQVTATRNGSPVDLSVALSNKANQDGTIDTVMIDLNKLNGLLAENDEVVFTCAPADASDNISVSITATISMHVINQTPTLALILPGANKPTKYKKDFVLDGDFLMGYNSADLYVQTDAATNENYKAKVLCYDPSQELPLYTEMKKNFKVTPVNGYAKFDMFNYEPFDILFLTDFVKSDGSSDKAAAKKHVEDLGQLVDFRPMFSTKGHMSGFTHWKDKGFTANPVAPKSSQIYMNLVCYAHPMFQDVTTDGENIFIDSSEPSEKVFKMISEGGFDADKGIQGFEMSDATEFIKIAVTQYDATGAESDMQVTMTANTSDDRPLIASCERQKNIEARFMILSLNADATSNLTEGGIDVIISSLQYLLETDPLVVTDCHYEFVNEAPAGFDLIAYASAGGTGTPGDGRWSTAANWAPRHDALPTRKIDVRIAADCMVDNTAAQAANVKIIDDVTLTINANAALQAHGTLRHEDDKRNTSYTEMGDVYIKSDARGNGALIHGDAAGKTKAIVEMYSIATGTKTGTSGVTGATWQWMTTPYNDVHDAQYNYYGSWMYEYDNTAHAWNTQIRNGMGMTPFVGYSVTHEGDPITYWMQGTLVSTADQSINLANGKNLIGNSWTAPITIADFREEDFTNATATIILFNTGTDATGTGAIETTGTAGTYFSIPINQAGTFARKTISPMQAFEVDATAANAKLHLDYKRLVRTSTPQTEKMLAPERRGGMTTNDNGNEAKLRIFVKGQRYYDFLYLFKNERTTMGFDNGWDGQKVYSDNYDIPVLYVENADGDWQVSTQPSLAGTTFGFYQGEDHSYTIAFDYDGEERLWFYDSNTDQYTMVHSDSTYMFSSNYEDIQRRFMLTDYNPYYVEPIIPEIPDEPNDPIVTELTHVTVDGNMLTFTNATHKPMSIAVYDAAGKLVTRTTTEAPLYQVELSDVQGVYMVHMSAGDKKIVTKVVR